MVQNVFPNLFSPLQVGSLSIKNRIVMPSMSTNFGDPASPGEVTPRHSFYYGERARGGSGLIIVEAAATAPSKGARKLGLSLYDDRFIPGLRGLASVIKGCGAASGIQIAAMGAGRIEALKVDLKGCPDVSSLNANEYSAVSPLPHPIYGVVARELSVSQIDKISDEIANAARRACHAGFDVVEIHGAHGYLLCEFLSPRTNRRTDIYGGDIEGRSRFPLEVVKKVKNVINNETVLSYRVSATEFVEGGLNIEEVVMFAKMLQEAGIDMIHVSGGTNETPEAMNQVIPPMSYSPGRLVRFAQKIKEVVSIPVIAVQRINTPELAENILNEGKADLVATGRALIADPYWPLKAREGRIGEIRRCIACNQGCMEQIVLGKRLSCLYNVEVGHEGTRKRSAVAAKKKSILVVGGGPAGMEAALVLASRGHRVQLVEKQDSLGGRVKLAAMLNEKKEFAEVVKYFQKQLQLLSVDVRVGKDAAEILNSEIYHFDDVVMASGATEIVPRMELKGTSYKIRLAKEVFLEPESVGLKVSVIGGGSVGIEVAEFLYNLGKEITVIEMLDRICSDLGPLNRADVLERLKSKPISIMLNTKVLSLENRGIVVSKEGKEDICSAPDTVVIATGVRPVPLVVGETKVPVHYVGDCSRTGNAMDAIHGAFKMVRNL